MKKIIALTFIFQFSIFNFFAQSLTGYDIMKKNDEVPQAKTASFTATMTLTDKKGQTRVREVIEKSKDFGTVKKSVIVFTTPKDVSGVGYLMFDYDEEADGTKKDTDSWLYLPAVKKVRRISGSDSSGDFMGTDFTYEDMGERGLSKDDFTLLGEEAVDGTECYKLEAKAKDLKDKNPRRIFWIGKENFMLYKGEFYDRQNNLQRELFCSEIKIIDGFWTTGKMLMKNVQKNHTTLLEMKNVSYGVSVDDSLLTVSALEKGRVR
ncbi:MAG: outer membrane lipoprotein-sorting protein [Treponema sp.]|nr:outer membrane lipoprotein-sorting protein [Treponema sp.]